MQLAQSKQQIQMLQQQMSAMAMDLKYGTTVKQAQEAEETKRELMRQTSKAHNTETMAQVKVNDQNTRAITSQNKSEIDGIVQLLLHHMDTRRLEDEIDRRNVEQQTAAQYAVADITQGANPLTQPQRVQ
jgi:chromosome segregation ATPase